MKLKRIAKVASVVVCALFPLTVLGTGLIDDKLPMTNRRIAGSR